MQVSSKKQAHSEKYHRAAVDGYVDMLCDASKRDANAPLADESRATPTHLAAQFGQLEALRILVGRGGEPERCTADGSSALHLAAARNHLNCVSFLVNFGVNLWALDNELRTAKDVAALASDRVGGDSLDYLDCAMAKQSAINTRSVQKLKERAKLGAEKRLKSVRKAQLKAIKQAERDERFLVRLSHQRRLLKAAHSMSDIKLVGRADQSAANQLGGRDYLFREVLHSAHTSLSQTSLAGSVSMSNLATASGNNRFMAPTSSEKCTNLISRFTRKHQSQLAANQKSESSFGSSSISSSTCASVSSSGAASQTSQAKQRLPAQQSSNNAHMRPKYSDLVAVSFSPDSCAGSSVQSSGGANSSSRSSVKSQSTIASRLRAIGGVSRKVHLRKLLLPAATATTTTTTPTTAMQQLQQKLSTQQVRSTPSFERTQLVAEANKCDTSESSRLSSSTHSEALEQQSKHCNVRPANKLKLSSGVEKKQLGCSLDATGGLTRAKSEPDFIQTSASDATTNEFGPAQAKGQTVAVEPPAPPPMPMAPLAGRASKASTSGSTNQAPQKNLIEQCLSQLKSSSMSCADGFALAAANNSDELLRHQINAGEFPLRPSLIKQQTSRSKGTSICAPVNESIRLAPIRSTSLSSADSIGSASSLVGDRRNPNGETRSTLTLNQNLLALASISSNPSVSKAAPTTSTTSGCTGDSSCAASTTRQVASGASVDRCHCTAAIKRWACDEKLVEFLCANGLADLSDVFARERIDLEALMLLTESDLRSLEILLGPRRKLLNAIDCRRKSVTATKQRSDESNVRQTGARQPMFVMVDTQL